MSNKQSQFRSKEGVLQIKSNHKWISYSFKTSGVYFHYFKSGKKVGQIFKHDIREVIPSAKYHKGAEHCFEVHHSGPGSPWILSASTQEECTKWMECLQKGSSNQFKIPQSPNSLSLHTPQSPPSWSGFQPDLYDTNHLTFQSTTSTQDGFVRRHSYGGGHMFGPSTLQPGGQQFMKQYQSNANTEILLENSYEQPVTDHQCDIYPLQRSDTYPRGPPPHQTHHPYLSSTPQGQGAVNQPTITTQASEDDYLYMAKESSPTQAEIFQQLRRPVSSSRLCSGNQHNVPLRRHTVSTGALLGHIGSGYDAQMQTHMHRDRYHSGGEQIQLNDDMDYLYMEKGRGPTAAEISEQAKHYDSQRLQENQLSSPPSTSQPNDDGYEYMEKGVGPTFNHLIPGDSNPQPPPLPTRQHGGSDNFHYFSTEQVRMLADMFTQMVKTKEGESFPKHPDNQTSASPSDLNIVLKRSSMAYPDQILVEDRQNTVVAEDLHSQKWAHASSTPNVNPLVSFAEDINPLFKEAFTINRESLSDFTKIGKGQYGEVQSALYRPSPGSAPIKVAVKKTKEGCSPKEKENFLKEIIVMAQFMHPNIVRVFGSVDEGVPSPWLVLEYLSNGDLKTFLKNNQRPIHRLVKYMVDVAMGMHYLSEKGFVHRDLAARNIFMDENELCKVGDFGLLRETTKHEDSEDEFYVMQSSLALPIRWMAMESITDKIFSSASDVWSFGVLMWELFNPGVTPYKALKNFAVIAEVSAGKRLHIPAECPKIVGELMQACWITDYTKRPSFLVIANLLCRCIQEKPTPTITYQHI